MLSGGVETETNSRYVWRGLAFSEGAVQQSSLYCGLAGLTATLWLNHDYNSPSGQVGLNEVDLSVGYEFGVGRLSVEPSYTNYSYPNQEESPSSGELAAVLSFDLGYFSLRSEQSLDVRTYPGAYYGDLGVECSASLSERWSLEAGALFGWASTEFATAYAGDASQPYRVAGMTGRLSWYPAPWLYVSPLVSVSSQLSPGYESVVGALDLWQVGVAVGTEVVP